MVQEIIAGMVPQMAQGEHEAAQQQAYRLMTSLISFPALMIFNVCVFFFTCLS
jgi:hypothetical protein